MFKGINVFLYLLTFQIVILDEVITTPLFSYFSKELKVELPFLIPTKYKSFELLF